MIGWTILALVLLTVSARAAWVDQTEQSTQGHCSPAVAKVEGSVTFMINCPQEDPEVITKLNLILSRIDFSDVGAIAVRRLEELLRYKDLDLQQHADYIKEWKRKYEELEKRVMLEADDSESSQQIATAMQQGDLELAGRLLDEILEKREKDIDTTASMNHNRAEIYVLQDDYEASLPYYKRAVQYRPEHRVYMFAYAEALRMAGHVEEAEKTYETLVDQLASSPEPVDAFLLGAALSIFAQIYVQQEEYPKAAALLERSVGAELKYAETYSDLNLSVFMQSSSQLAGIYLGVIGDDGKAMIVYERMFNLWLRNKGDLLASSTTDDFLLAAGFFFIYLADNDELTRACDAAYQGLLAANHVGLIGISLDVNEETRQTTEELYTQLCNNGGPPLLNRRWR